jgi:hypothetical protein
VTWAIHEPAIADADEMGWVHVTVWQQAYIGLMSAAPTGTLEVRMSRGHLER